MPGRSHKSRSRSRRKRRSRGPSSNRKSRSRNNTRSPAQHRPRSRDPASHDPNAPSTSTANVEEDIPLTDLNDVLEDPSDTGEGTLPALPENMGIEEEQKLNTLCQLLEKMEKQYSPTVSKAGSNASTPEKKDKGSLKQEPSKSLPNTDATKSSQKSDSDKQPKSEKAKKPQQNKSSAKSPKKENVNKSQSEKSPKKQPQNTQEPQKTNTEAEANDKTDESKMTQEEKAALRKAKKEQKKQGKLKKPDNQNPIEPDNNKENKSPSEEQNDQPGKSKAELKKERREKQEAQRLAKLEQQKKAEATKSQAKPTVKIEQTKKLTANKTKVKRSESEVSKVPLVGHLYRTGKKLPDFRLTSDHIHPAVKDVGFRMKKKIIDGCNARLVAILSAFKKVVADYRTPASCDLSRDLSNKISSNVKFLDDCRVLPTSIENAIRSFKTVINNISPDLPEAQAKEQLIKSLETYIKTNIILANTAITQLSHTAQLVQDTDIILTYGYSYLAFEVINDAVKKGKNIDVVVIENTDNPTGLSLLHLLNKIGVNCRYTTLSNIPNIMEKVTKVLVEAESVMLNGSVVGHAGQAAVCMMAHHVGTPVIVMCQTYKFCNSDVTDSLDNNELGDEESLLNDGKERLVKNDFLFVANLQFDVTPAEIVTCLATERGQLATSSVPVIIRRNFGDVFGQD